MKLTYGTIYRLSELGTKFKVVQYDSDKKKPKVRLKKIGNGYLTGKDAWAGWVSRQTFDSAFVKEKNYKPAL